MVDSDLLTMLLVHVYVQVQGQLSSFDALKSVTLFYADHRLQHAFFNYCM